MAHSKKAVRTRALARITPRRWVVLGTALVWHQAGAVESDSIQEVTVTAQKRSESIQEVPMSLQALSGDSLVSNGFVSLEDYARLATNVSFAPDGTGNKNGTQLSIRGVSPLAGVSTVAFYIDDTPNNGAFRAGGMDPHVYDISRIEILKGPQGNLYGSSAMGGLIKIVTNQPKLNQLETAYNVTGSYTNYGTANFAVDGVANLPLIADKLALRVVASYGSDGGFVDYVSPFPNGNVLTAQPPASTPTQVPFPYIDLPTTQHVNSSTLQALRASLRWAPTDSLTITPSVFYQNNTANALSAVYQDTFGYSGPPRQSPYVPESVSTKFTLSSLTVEGKTGLGTITSSTSNLDATGNSADDLTSTVTQLYLNADPTLVSASYITPIFNRTTMSDFTQELRFTSDWEFPVSAVAGLYYESRNKNDAQSMFFKEGGAAYFGVPTDLLFVKTQTAYYGDKSVYANLTYKFLSRFEIQAGGRESILSVGTGRYGDGLLNGGVSASKITEVTKGNHAFAASASVHLNDDDLIYTRVAQGYRPGSPPGTPPPVAVCGETNTANQLNPDHTMNYELGLKTMSAGGRLLFNATGFLIKYTDVQQAILLPQCGYTVNGNAGSATSKGFELELDAKFLDGALTVQTAVGYTKSVLDQGVQTVGADPGEWLVNVPDWTGNLSLEYRRPLPWADHEGYARIDERYVGRRFGDFGLYGGPPNSDLIAHGYGLLDIRFGVASKSYDFSIFVSNATDKRAQLAYENLGPRITYINRPRTVGLNIRKDL